MVQIKTKRYERVEGEKDEYKHIKSGKKIEIERTPFTYTLKKVKKFLPT